MKPRARSSAEVKIDQDQGHGKEWRLPSALSRSRPVGPTRHLELLLPDTRRERSRTWVSSSRSSNDTCMPRTAKARRLFFIPSTGTWQLASRPCDSTLRSPHLSPGPFQLVLWRVAGRRQALCPAVLDGYSRLLVKNSAVYLETCMCSHAHEGEDPTIAVVPAVSV